MTLETAEDVKRALRRPLGNALTAELWEHARERGWVQDVIDAAQYGPCEDDADGALAELITKVRDAAAWASKLAAARAEPRVSSAKAPRSSPPTYGLDALSELMALEAQSHRLVVTFRERVLAGKRLQPSEVAAWLRAHDCHLWLGPPWPPVWAHEMLWAARMERLGLDRFDVPEDDVDFMIVVIDMLKDEYGWPDPLEVAGFVLSGETPSLPPAIAFVDLTRDRFFPKTARVCLEVSPQMDPRDLMALYASMRHVGMPTNSRIRPPDEAMSRLAVFVARNNTGGTWREAWRAWNAVGERQYADERSFTRDAHKAYRMVSGEELDWHGGTSAKREEQS